MVVITKGLELLIPLTICTANELAGLARGGQKLGKLKKNYFEAVKLLVELASLQTSFITLDSVIKVTNRRVNAIEHGESLCLSLSSIFPLSLCSLTWVALPPHCDRTLLSLLASCFHRWCHLSAFPEELHAPLAACLPGLANLVQSEKHDGSHQT